MFKPTIVAALLSLAIAAPALAQTQAPPVTGTGQPHTRVAPRARRAARLSALGSQDRAKLRGDLKSLRGQLQTLRKSGASTSGQGRRALKQQMRKLRRQLARVRRHRKGGLGA